jgi:AcrR family transcriptional regulator
VDTVLLAAEPPAEPATGLAAQPPTGLAARKKERTRHQLAEAAAQLFYQRGYDATTIDDIVAAVDVSPRTFFRYFPTKEDLVVALGQTSLSSFLDALAERPASEALLTSVQRAIENSLALSWQDTTRVRSFLTLLQDTPVLRARWLEESNHNRGLLAAVIAARTDGEPSGTRNLLIAGGILLAMNTALQVWADQEGDGEIADLVYRALAELTTPLLTP